MLFARSPTPRDLMSFVRPQDKQRTKEENRLREEEKKTKKEEEKQKKEKVRRASWPPHVAVIRSRRHH